MTPFTSHGRHYEYSKHGAIHQTDAQPYTYDPNYCATYDTEAYKRDSDLLQSLRYAYAVMANRGKIHSLLDVGYGNGAFMLHAKRFSDLVYGSDVTGIRVDGCMIVDHLKMTEWVDVATFFDSLEHMESWDFLKEMKAKTVVVSLPYCHIFSKGQDWFDNHYPHRKPDEHLWHHSASSLGKTMDSLGWKQLTTPTELEDVVRVSKHGAQNILTMAFSR